jgi:ubiquinone/menaquinone biosynthesis C-methylase UbiE
MASSPAISEHTTASLPHNLRPKLRCLSCHAALKEAGDNILSCLDCGQSYPIHSGIPSLIGGGPESQAWNNWDRGEIKMTGNSYYKRSKGEMPEKESSKSYARFLKRHALYTPDDSILDLGCATGHFYRSFRDRLDSNVHYTGLDSNGQFLHWGGEVFGISSRCNFVHGDVLDMPFADDSFDLLVVNLFHFFPNIVEAMREAMRVTRKRVIWRTPIGQTNYIVKVVNQNDFDTTGVLKADREDLNYCLYILYSKTYIDGLIHNLGGRVSFIERDTDFEPFDNTVLDEFKHIPSTKTVGDMQINGNLVLDWQYVVIDC